MSRRTLGTKVLMHVLLVPFLIFALFPFYHMLLTSLKQDRELYDRFAVPLAIKQGPTLEHYTKLLRETEFLTWTKNSLMVTVLATTASVIIGTVAAYALSRLKFRGVNSFGTGIFVTYLVPTSLLFLPLAQVINWIGLADSKWALVVTYPTFLVPFCTWLLMGYFRTVPKEVEECAMVDGATRIQALWRIVLPIAIPGLVCAVLFAFTLSWNEFIYALTFTSSSEQITASVGVTSELIRGDIYFWGELMAGAILGSVPIVILYVFFLDYYVSPEVLAALTDGILEGLARPPERDGRIGLVARHVHAAPLRAVEALHGHGLASRVENVNHHVPVVLLRLGLGAGQDLLGLLEADRRAVGRRPLGQRGLGGEDGEGQQ